MITNDLNVDYEGSYQLGDADGEIWARHARADEIQSISQLSPDEVGQRDVLGQESASWLSDKAAAYYQQDPSFEAYSYYEGFLTSVRRRMQARVFTASVGARRRF